MQTEFKPELLTKPDFLESEKIIRKCVHCGFCTATCPTYVLLGNELDSPRGRIYLMKEMLEKDRPATPEIVKHIDRCLSCLSCMTTCPSGVNYMHLVDHGRAHIEKTYRRPFWDRTIRALLAATLPYRTRFRLALAAALLGKPFKGLFRHVEALKPVAAMLELAPLRVSGRSPEEGPAVFRPREPRRARVALLANCAQPVLAPHINEATIRLLNRLGVEVVIARGEGCCGAIVHHMGRDRQGHELARRNIDAWTREIEGEGLDAIVINVSGCGTAVKDYGFQFRMDPDYRDKAARVSGLAKDISEFLFALGPMSPTRPTGLTLAYHPACSLQHGQAVRREPKALLQAAGFTVRDIPESHICCGSAGTYNILQPDIAMRLRDRKVENIALARPDAIATGNIGCITQIGSGTDIPILHTVELLDWATGGPLPPALERAGLGARAPFAALEAAE